MKTLLYTISDFSFKAKECIELMYNSINQTKDFDFVVVTNNKNYPKNLPVIVDDSNINYIGDLKYSSKIPEGYSRYIYLDSDILFFGSINELYDDREYSLVFELGKPMSLEFFSYPFSDNNHKIIEKNLTGINAGTFSFKNYYFLKEVREKINNIKLNNDHLSARYEQSAFNYVISKSVNYNFSLIKDLTPITSLFAQNNPYNENKKIYHFCGFNGNMVSKYNLMEKFNNEVLQYKK